MNKTKQIVALFFALALFLTGCTPDADSVSHTDAADTSKLRVISTIFPPYDFTKQIAGDMIENSMLLPFGVESHTYEPTPKDLIALEDSDLFIYIGGVGDYWIEQVLASMGDRAPKTLRLMDHVDLLAEVYAEGMEQEDHDHDGDGVPDHSAADHDDHDHDHDGIPDHSAEDHDGDLKTGDMDEHIWTSPKRVIQLVSAIESTLSELDPAHAAEFQANAQAYIAQLEILDQNLTELVQNAARRTIIVGDRFPFRYLAHDYNLEYYAAFLGCSTQTEPSVQTVSFLSDRVRDEQLPVVLYLEFSSGKIADTVARAGGAQTAVLYSAHNVSQQEFDAGITYLQIMDKNLQVLEEALS